MSAKQHRVVVLGATGSIGESAAKVARTLPDRMKMVGLSGLNNQLRLLELYREFQPMALCTGHAEGVQFLSDQLKEGETEVNSVRIFQGEEGLLSLATLPEADFVLVAIVGTAGLGPALAALEAGKDLAVASKEILVMAGEQVMATAARRGRRVLPVDSEHNAIFQCLDGRDVTTVRRIILTCSGGPFRQVDPEEFSRVTPEMALRHPTWSMGRKISIDSATLFNKGLEMIEAHWLFGVPMEKIEVIIHPQSVIHSMVEFVDGSILAQMSEADMSLPIQYAMTYPDRVAGSSSYLDLPGLGRLDFERPREEVFPAIQLARRAGSIGGTLPAVLNAANEAAVASFLAGEMTFPGIWESVQRAMESIPFIEHPTLEQLLATTAATKAFIAKQDSEFQPR